MPPPSFLSVSAQVAAHLSAELIRGRWSKTMPGRNHLAAELGVNRKTAEAALRQLEREGLLVGQGPGRMRRIVRRSKNAAQRPLRVAMLLCEAADRRSEYVVELQHTLVEAGHRVIFAKRTLTELRWDVKRVAGLVGKTAADAWVVVAGSREVLAWFSVRPTPAFALFGNLTELPIAGTGPHKSPAFAAATRELVALGHRRVVVIARKLRRLPKPGRPEHAFLEELAAHGIPTGPFNLPDWEETTEGYQELLASLFRVTPPTALIIEEAPLFAAAQQFFARRGLRVPEDVSLVCTDPDLTFAYCVPSIAHMRWDATVIVRRVVRWAANVSHGTRDVRQAFTAAKFVPGGTIGPVPHG